MWHEKMRIYKLKRSEEFDKTGRPALLLDFFGDHCLVWTGTTMKTEKAHDKPLKMNFDAKPCYFYNYNIQQVLTSDIKGWWTNNKNEPCVLTNAQQRLLIGKFAHSITNQKNPYQKITSLALENERLRKENEQLKKENQLLKQKEKEVLLREQELEDEYEYQ